MKKILLVDDDESIQLLYNEELNEEGYEVISAIDGEEALEKFQQQPVDLVILDIQMPGMNGIEVLRRMKTINPEIPVILSSAYTEYKQDLSSWASDEYVVKSADLKELKNAVNKFIG